MITLLLVPADIKEKLGRRLNAFCGESTVSTCCRDPRGTNDLRAKDYDWDAARARGSRLFELGRGGMDPDQMVSREAEPTIT